MNAHTAEDPTTRDARLRRRNRTALAWVGAVLAVLMVAGYFYAGWLLRHPPVPTVH